MKCLIHRNQKMLKFLFARYSGTSAGAASSRVASFDLYNEKAVTLADIAKMLRELAVTQQMLAKKDVQTLVRQLSSR